MKSYKIERKMVKIKTGWFSSEIKPMWCLVECGTHLVSSYGGGSSVDVDELEHSSTILYSEDKDYILEELANFNGEGSGS